MNRTEPRSDVTIYWVSDRSPVDVVQALSPRGRHHAVRMETRRARCLHAYTLADQADLRRMRTAARAYFDAHLTQEENYMRLMKTYSDVMAQNDLGNARRQ